jgi:integrase
VSTGTDKKHVAVAKLDRIIREKEEELAGLLAPKALRDAARRPIAEHLADHVAHLAALSRTLKHLAYTKNRILRVCEACGWKLLRDITADGFDHWRAGQSSLGPNTCNKYLAHLSGFLRWLENSGRIAQNALKTVSKAETRGHERCERRALSDAELARLIEVPDGRGLIYFTAALTGLRKGETKSVMWADMHLDGPCPFIAVRASTTKNHKTAQQPLIPPLAAALRAFRDKEVVRTGKVFRRGVPKPKTMRRDLEACGIPYLDELGRRVDFHSLRHTFCTMLQRAGVPPRVIMELMRQSDLRLSSTTYTDTTCLPLFDEVGKLGTFLPSPLASPKFAKTCQNVGKPVQTELLLQRAEFVVFPVKESALGMAVPSWDSGELAEREGFEPPSSQQQKSFAERALSCLVVS